MQARSVDIAFLKMQPLTHLELLVASLLPTAAILFVGAIGSRMIIPSAVGLFCIVFLFFSLAIFCAELALISTLQRIMKNQLAGFTAVCQAYLAGNKEVRAAVYGEQSLTATFAHSLNSLLDFVTAQENQHRSQSGASEQSEEPLKKQLKQLAHNIAPVMDGDLREKAPLATGDIGIITDSCNYLITQLIQQIKWTRHASEQVIRMTREMLDHSIEFAQHSEAQLLLLAQLTETQEQLRDFLQHLSSTLQLYLDQAYAKQTQPESSQDFLTDGTSPDPIIIDSALVEGSHIKQPDIDTHHREQLLADTLDTVQEYITTAEHMLGDLHTLAQHIHYSGASVLSSAERTNALVPLAERWRDSVAAFYLPGEGNHLYLND